MYEKDTQEQIATALQVLTDEELSGCAGGAGETSVPDTSVVLVPDTSVVVPLH